MTVVMWMKKEWKKRGLLEARLVCEETLDLSNDRKMDIQKSGGISATNAQKRSEFRSAASDSSDSAASATAEAFGNDLADGLPWADDMRAAFVGAMAAMTAMHWPVFSTVHLVLGLTYVSNGLVATAISRTGIDPAKARRALRELFTKEVTANEQQGSIVSDNLKTMLRAAKSTAADCGASEVREVHLVLALLDCGEAGGTLLLQLLKIDLDQLRGEALKLLDGKAKKVRSDFLLPNGSLDQTQFDEECWSALEESTRMAYRSYWPDLRSPHLFLGVLNRRGSRLAEHLGQTTEIAPNTLATSFLAMLMQSTRIDASLGQPKLHREFLSENALNTLRAAQQFVRQRDGEVITERDLLTAIFDNENNVVTNALQTAGIETQSLIW